MRSFSILTLLIFTGSMYSIFQSEGDTLSNDFGSKFNAAIYFAIASPFLAVFIGIFYNVGLIFLKMAHVSAGLERILSFVFMAAIFFCIAVIFLRTFSVGNPWY
jgi:hypothetical protein